MATSQTRLEISDIEKMNFAPIYLLNKEKDKREQYHSFLKREAIVFGALLFYLCTQYTQVGRRSVFIQKICTEMGICYGDYIKYKNMFKKNQATGLLYNPNYDDGRLFYEEVKRVCQQKLVELTSDSKNKNKLKKVIDIVDDVTKEATEFIAEKMNNCVSAITNSNEISLREDEHLTIIEPQSIVGEMCGEACSYIRILFDGVRSGSVRFQDLIDHIPELFKTSEDIRNLALAAVHLKKALT